MSVRNFLLHNDNKRIVIKAWVYCGYFRFLIKCIPMKHLEKCFGEKGKESSKLAEKHQYQRAVVVGHEVNRIADKTLWESKCLVRALAAQKILHKSGIETTLYLGVGKDEQNQMIAHAWLRCGECYVTGGKGTEYAVVAKYKK